MGKIIKYKKILIIVLMLFMVCGAMYSLVEIVTNRYDKILVDYSRLSIGKMPKYAVLDKEKTQAKYDEEGLFVSIDGPDEYWACFKGEGYYIEVKFERYLAWAFSEDASVAFVSFKGKDLLSGPIEFEGEAWKIAKKIRGITE